MDKPDLLLDLDGVARNFIAGALPIIHETTGRSFHHDEVDQWRIEHALGLSDAETKALYDRIGSEGWCRALPVYDGAKEGIATLREHVNVYPVTFQYPSLWWVRECEEWLLEHFGIDPNTVAHTNAKHICFGDYFVEDKTQTLVTWREKWRKRGLHPTPILFNRRYNARDGWDGVSVNGWDELTTFVVGDIASRT